MTARVQKLINRPEDLVDEMLAGFCAAYSDIVRLSDKRLVVRAQPKAPGKVGLVIGNGSGHEPAMIGLAFGIDVSRVTDEADLAALEAAISSLGEAAADPADLAASLVSDIAAEYQALIEADWEAKVLQG